jgi:hypothetical protein
MTDDEWTGAYTGQTVNLNRPRPTVRLDDDDDTLAALLDLAEPDRLPPYPQLDGLTYYPGGELHPPPPPAPSLGLFLGGLVNFITRTIQFELDRRERQLIERQTWAHSRAIERAYLDGVEYGERLGRQPVMRYDDDLPPAIPPPPPAAGVWVGLENLPPGETEITVRVQHLPERIPPPPQPRRGARRRR